MNHKLFVYKRRLTILCVMLLVVLLTAGVSYALFTSTTSQEDENSLAASCMDMEFTGKNEINLTNAYPITENEAEALTPYTFTITNKCDNYIEYYVIASVIDTSTSADSKYVKVSLSGDTDKVSEAITSLKTITTPQSLNGYNIKENYILKEGDGISEGESRTFNFRMWLDGDNSNTWTTEELENKTYQVKISVVGTVKTSKDDLFIAALVDGKESTSFPTTDNYATSVTCTKNGKTINAKASLNWTGSEWELTTKVTTGNVRCNTKFDKKGVLYQTILADNEVQTPLTTPGTEVSAYTLDDVTTTSTSSVSSTDQAYYITYGTGWEANGTKFNLTGASVTTDTYASSYSSLVGKYLPSQYISSSGSSTAGTMKTTTNLSGVYYVVSATSSSFTYKVIYSNKNTTEVILASAEDDYGTSYYFRGSVKNNYVEFANKCWRIVRIGGDNTVKLILHNDNTANAANPCSSANNSTTAALAHYNGSTYKSKFNTSYNDNAYVGFMYGTPGSTTYEATHANTNKSTILTNLETWYNNNLKTYESLIADNVFCNDKNISGSGLGYGINTTYYMAYERLNTNKTPSLKCNGDLSKITSKVGLITADELTYAGYASGLYNSGTYLHENAAGSSWWSLSPYGFRSDNAFVWFVRGVYGGLDYSIVYLDVGVRPYISLKSSVKVTGDGTSENPYKIVS